MEELNQTKGLLNTAINHHHRQPDCQYRSQNDRWYSNAEVLDEMRAGKPTVYVNSCSNFDNTQLALQMESLTKALGQVMHISAWRTTQLVDDHRTGLSTYLVAKENKGGDGFANIAQSMSGLYADGMALTNSVIGYGVPTSIGIEETFSNLNATADRLSKMADVGYEIYAYEVLHHTGYGYEKTGRQTDGPRHNKTLGRLQKGCSVRHKRQNLYTGHQQRSEVPQVLSDSRQ